MLAELAAPKLGSCEHFWFDLRRKFDLGYSRLPVVSERLPKSFALCPVAKCKGELAGAPVG